MRVRVAGKRISVRPEMAIGKGGEADVFELPGSRVLKLFKQPDHPDLSLFPEDQRAAARRIEEHQDKLVAFPSNLPERVIAPLDVARQDRGKQRIVGYVMRRVDGAEALHTLCDPQTRRQPGMAERVLRIARDLHTTVKAVHDGGVVIGDFNDLNVLVRGDAAYLIDADSFQYGSWRCNVFTERFVDPLLCDPARPSPVLHQPYNQDSDWYAFTIMVMRLLLCVGPYGGVHRPAAGSRVPHGARPMRRLTLFQADVVPPRPAIPASALPPDLVHYLRGVFEGDRRGVFPIPLLESIRFHVCGSCGLEHARSRCPGCRNRATPRPPVTVRGSVRATAVAPVPAPSPHANAAHRYWIQGGALVRDGAHAPVRLGAVMGAAQFWVGKDWGLGFYRAGRLTVGFLFDAERPGLNDQVVLPPLAGNLIRCHGVVGEERGWLFILEQSRGQRLWHRVVVDRRGAVIATEQATDQPDSWTRGVRGAVAVGTSLLVPTDDGIVRVEVDDGVTSVTRRFPDTAPFLDSSFRLVLADRGLVASAEDHAHRLTIG